MSERMKQFAEQLEGAARKLGKPDDACQWFVLCVRTATTTIAHPIMGDVRVRSAPPGLQG